MERSVLDGDNATRLAETKTRTTLSLTSAPRALGLWVVMDVHGQQMSGPVTASKQRIMTTQKRFRNLMPRLATMNIP